MKNESLGKLVDTMSKEQLILLIEYMESMYHIVKYSKPDGLSEGYRKTVM